MVYSEPWTVLLRGSVLGRFCLVGREVGSSSGISSISRVGMLDVFVLEMHFSLRVLDGFWSVFLLTTIGELMLLSLTISLEIFRGFSYYLLMFY